MIQTPSDSPLQLVGDTAVVPVIVIDDPAQAVPLARALLAGGLRVLEVTLRTPAALAAVRGIIEALPEAVVGVGSVIEPRQFELAKAAGAAFAVSPGATDALVAAAQSASVPWLPGAQTASEVLKLRAAGHRFLKFFPAESSGGVAFLRSLAGPVADVSFCPTGGIDAGKAASYLALPNVRCIGGSWMCGPELVRAGNWEEVARRAAAAAALR